MLKMVTTYVIIYCLLLDLTGIISCFQVDQKVILMSETKYKTALGISGLKEL